MDGTTIGAAFAGAVAAHGDRPFLAVPANPARGYLPAGFEISYGEAGRRVDALAALYRAAGYGLGHRVATLLENHPDHILHKLALNSIGACLVPINPDYRAAETAYLIEHSAPDLVVTLGNREGQVGEALEKSAHRPEVIVSERFASSLPKARRPAEDGAPEPGDAGQRALHVGDDGAAQGLRPVARLRSGRRRALCRAGRPGGAASRPRPHLQPAAALSRQRGRVLAVRRHPVGQLPDPARPLPSRALVARDRRDTGDGRALPRHHRGHAAQPACRTRRRERTACASASAPASSRSSMGRSSSASAFP